ncbi:MAG: hypothetical protein RQ885_07695 [Desulfurococcales archaeon]|nr:hypothetical protein [Desulfurococcales archaeon]
MISRKIESNLVTHSGVKSLIPLQGANTQDPETRYRLSPALMGGEGAMRCQEVDNGGKDSAKTETLG